MRCWMPALPCGRELLHITLTACRASRCPALHEAHVRMLLLLPRIANTCHGACSCAAAVGDSRVAVALEPRFHAHANSPQPGSLLCCTTTAEAVDDFSAAIEQEPRFHDFHKRRGQALMGAFLQLFVSSRKKLEKAFLKNEAFLHVQHVSSQRSWGSRAAATEVPHLGVRRCSLAARHDRPSVLLLHHWLCSAGGRRRRCARPALLH